MTKDKLDVITKNSVDFDEFVQSIDAVDSATEGLTEDQKRAYKAVQSGENVFITGEAGTGKSHLLKRIIANSTVNTVVCAPTGIAAIKINGMTIHKLLRLKPSQSLINNYPSRCPDTLWSADRIIVDEISMCRSDLFSWLINTIKMTRHKIQIIVVGDFCQLPPVITSVDREFFKDGNEFAFRTKEWQDCHFTNVVLHEIIRQQGDPDFTRALNRIRMGDPRGIAYINKHSAKEKQETTVTIASRNGQVDSINEREAKQFDDKYVFKAEQTGRINPKDVPAEDEIELAVGERVICTVNDRDDEYRNGTQGTIVDIDHDSVAVEDAKTGNIFTVIPHEWTSYEYKTVDLPTTEKVKVRMIDKNGKEYIEEQDHKTTKKQLKKTEIGSIIQIPLRLGYAMTVHKSQGQTFDGMNLIPAGWASGLLYVSLSRVRDVKSLHLTEPLKAYMVYLDPVVRDFYHKIDPNEPEYLKPPKMRNAFD